MRHIKSHSILPSERRLDEERLQMEAKKREREEQHLYLTAKVRMLPSRFEMVYLP